MDETYLVLFESGREVLMLLHFVLLFDMLVEKRLISFVYFLENISGKSLYVH